MCFLLHASYFPTHAFAVRTGFTCLSFFISATAFSWSSSAGRWCWHCQGQGGLFPSVHNITWWISHLDHGAFLGLEALSKWWDVNVMEMIWLDVLQRHCLSLDPSPGLVPSALTKPTHTHTHTHTHHRPLGEMNNTGRHPPTPLFNPSSCSQPHSLAPLNMGHRAQDDLHC